MNCDDVVWNLFISSHSFPPTDYLVEWDHTAICPLNEKHSELHRARFLINESMGVGGMDHLRNVEINKKEVVLANRTVFQNKTYHHETLFSSLSNKNKTYYYVVHRPEKTLASIALIALSLIALRNGIKMYRKKIENKSRAYYRH